MHRNTLYQVNTSPVLIKNMKNCRKNWSHTEFEPWNPKLTRASPAPYQYRAYLQQSVITGAAGPVRPRLQLIGRQRSPLCGDHLCVAESTARSPSSVIKPSNCSNLRVLLVDSRHTDSLVFWGHLRDYVRPTGSTVFIDKYDTIRYDRRV